MTRGPSIGTNRSTSSVEKVAESWGAFAPDWVSVLADQCDATSQRHVAGQLGYSPALISNVLAAKYTGDLAAVEQAVNARFAQSQVECPVLGSIAAGECYDHQGRPFSTANPQHVKLYRACPTCRHYARRRTR